VTDETRRRRRRRASAAQGPPPQSHSDTPRPGPEAAPGAVPVAEGVAAASAQAGRTRRPAADRDQAERGLRDLVGAGHSQLGVSGALRGRDVNRPTEEDIAEAEQSIVIVRRNWQPPATRT
jgi:hypothetical protein